MVLPPRLTGAKPRRCQGSRSRGCHRHSLCPQSCRRSSISHFAGQCCGAGPPHSVGCERSGRARQLNRCIAFLLLLSMGSDPRLSKSDKGEYRALFDFGRSFPSCLGRKSPMPIVPVALAKWCAATLCAAVHSAPLLALHYWGAARIPAPGPGSTPASLALDVLQR